MNMTMRKRKAALCACSDPLSESRRPQIGQLVNMLESRGLSVVCSPYLFGCAEPDQGKSKADVLSGFFVGHGSNARAIVIGREIEIGKIGE